MFEKITSFDSSKDKCCKVFKDKVIVCALAIKKKKLKRFSGSKVVQKHNGNFKLQFLDNANMSLVGQWQKLYKL